MKNFFYLLTLVVFLISAPLAMAADEPAGKAPAAGAKPSINCCNKGQCKQVASEMGGSISVESEVDIGSTFRVRLLSWREPAEVKESGKDG